MTREELLDKAAEVRKGLAWHYPDQVICANAVEVIEQLEAALLEAQMDEEGLQRTLAENERLKATAGFEPFGLIWRPKAGSNRWQHRMSREGRAYPSNAEFIDVYRAREIAP